MKQERDWIVIIGTILVWIALGMWFYYAAQHSDASDPPIGDGPRQ